MGPKRSASSGSPGDSGSLDDGSLLSQVIAGPMATNWAPWVTA